MKDVGVAVIGAGRMGEFYGRMLSGGISGAKLAGMAGHPGKEKLAGTLGTTWFGDVSRLFHDPGVDMVMICTRTPSHAALATEAAQAGKHVFCEKPLALTFDEADRAIEAARASGVLLTVGFMRRFDPAYANVRQQLVAGRLGRIISLRGTHRSAMPPDWVLRLEEGGGLALDYLVHEYDLARWLLGSEVRSVYAVGGALAHREKLAEVPDFMDQFAVLMQMENGATAAVEASCAAQYAYDVRTEVFGSGGLATVGELRADCATVFTGQGLHADLNESFLARFAEAFRLEVEHFVRCITEGRPPTVTGADGRAALRIGLAALRSLREGQPIEP